MRINELFYKKKPVISFEVFPPRPEVSLNTVFLTIEKLKDLNPDYISVTYGAGGGSRNRTIEIASKIKNEYNIDVLSHLTCVSTSPKDIDNILESLSNANVDNILALRGDVPMDTQISFNPFYYFSYASDLVSYIKKRQGFCIGAACYPEGHLQSTDKKSDISNLKFKVDCGVDFLVTQLFFDNKLFYTFLEEISKAGINVPVTAGIMPVFNSTLIKKFTSMCGASIPKKLRLILNKFDNSPDDLSKAGIEYAVNQINELIEYGVSGIHLYTMNKSDQVKTIMDNINIEKAR